MKTDWKVGDKCWVYLNLEQRIQNGTITEINNTVTLVSWDYTDSKGEVHHCSTWFFTANELFPTREALCEHYRKIFAE